MSFFEGTLASTTLLVGVFIALKYYYMLVFPSYVSRSRSPLQIPWPSSRGSFSDPHVCVRMRAQTGVAVRTAVHFTASSLLHTYFQQRKSECRSDGDCAGDKCCGINNVCSGECWVCTNI